MKDSKHVSKFVGLGQELVELVYFFANNFDRPLGIFFFWRHHQSRLSDWSLQNEDGLDGSLLNLFLLAFADVFGIEGHLQVCQKLVLTDEFLNDSDLVEGVSPSVLVNVHDESNELGLEVVGAQTDGFA